MTSHLGTLFAVARDSLKMSVLVPQEYQIRMRSDERDKCYLPHLLLVNSNVTLKLYGHNCKLFTTLMSRN